MSSGNAVSIAINLVGLAALAAAVGVSHQSIRKFERYGTSAKRVIALARASDWRVTPHDLRPDLYPNPFDALPPEVVARISAPMTVVV